MKKKASRRNDSLRKRGQGLGFPCDEIRAATDERGGADGLLETLAKGAGVWVSPTTSERRGLPYQRPKTGCLISGRARIVSNREVPPYMVGDVRGWAGDRDVAV